MLILRLESRTLTNAFVTAKTYFPLPPVPRLAQVPRYPVNSYSSSLFMQTKIQSFASRVDPLRGTNKTLHAGYSVRFEPMHGTYVNWPHALN